MQHSFTAPSSPRGAGGSFGKKQGREGRGARSGAAHRDENDDELVQRFAKTLSIHICVQPHVVLLQLVADRDKVFLLTTTDPRAVQKTNQCNLGTNNHKETFFFSCLSHVSCKRGDRFTSHLVRNEYFSCSKIGFVTPTL
jgi:hypothetical protein